MEAIRQIVTVKNNKINITLPHDFNADEVEVIIIPTIKKAKSNPSLVQSKVEQTKNKPLKNASISPNFLEVMKDLEKRS